MQTIFCLRKIHMQENFPKNNEKELTQQEKLKDSFLDTNKNNIEDLADFFEKILELDQQGTHVENADANIQLLHDNEILQKISLIKSRYPEYSDEIDRTYNSRLSLSYFHRGQKDVSYDDFKKSYEYALQSDYVHEGLDDKKKEQQKIMNQASLDYTLGIIKYFERDKEGLRKVIDNIPIIDWEKGWEKNTEILKRFVESLEQGEDPKENYYKRYNGE